LKVSIITVCYNSELTIRDTINSVLEQDYNDIEFIIIDGASSDSTLDIIREYGVQVSIVISEADNGIYDAMNKGIESSTGDIVGILNSDDFYTRSTVISDVVCSFKGDSELNMFLGSVDFVNQSNINKVVRTYSSRHFSKWQMRFGIMPPHPAAFMLRDSYIKAGLYNTAYKIGADFELLLRFLSIHKFKYRVDSSVLVRMRVGGVSTSGISSYILSTKEILSALNANKVYSNTFFVLLRLIVKVFQRCNPPEN